MHYLQGRHDGYRFAETKGISIDPQGQGQDMAQLIEA